MLPDELMLKEFDIDPPKLSQRSILFNIPAIGLGTPLAEGLLSYIVRLAACHSVSPRRLIKKVYAMDNQKITRCLYPSFFNAYSSTINGLGSYAEIFSNETAKLTKNDFIKNLTLLPIAPLLPIHGPALIAQKSQWCPKCLEQMQVSKEVYRPLAWSFKLYRICLKHQHVMQNKCPHCEKHQPFIPKTPYLHLCQYCRKSLGISDDYLVNNVDNHDLWVAKAIEHIISNLELLDERLSIDKFNEFISKAVTHYANGNRTKFCKAIGLNRWALKGWLTNDEKPSFPQLLTICYALDIMPSQIFLADTNQLFSADKRIRFTFQRALYRAKRPLLTNDQITSLTVDMTRVASNPEDNRPLSEVSKELGYAVTCLKYWCPKQSQEIISKHECFKSKITNQKLESWSQKVTDVVHEIRAENQYPSRRRVNLRLIPSKTCLARPEIFNAYLDSLSRMKSSS